MKKGSKPFFEKKLKDNLKQRLKNHQIASTIDVRSGRFFIEIADQDAAVCQQILKTTFGIVAYHRAFVAEKELEDISTKVIELANSFKTKGTRFKIEARRTDKSFSLTSYELAAELGGRVLESAPEHWQVDVKNPQITIVVEVRHKVFIYGKTQELYTQAAGGLPSGTAGKGVLLLSGGIDSPVAGYLMARRGLKLSAVHFYTPPYTSDAALAKARRLAYKLAPWNGGAINFYAVNFTPLQLAINKLGRAEYSTLLSRVCMTQIARGIARKKDAKALVTGEALAQVASQTLESLAFTNAMANYLVLRPCVGMDKEDIVMIAKKIDTFALSIEAETDCCSLFAAEHPVIHPHFEDSKALFASAGLEAMIEEAISASQAEILREVEV